MHTSTDINQWDRAMPRNPLFPAAPPDWTQATAESVAEAEGIGLTKEHWEAVRALQGYFARHDADTGISMREVHDALEEHFHARGGLKRLYQLFPGGPLAQGCRLAGLKPPPMASDTSFGSVA
jgi:tRNA 2-thiouridine synthesizing protein E